MKSCNFTYVSLVMFNQKKFSLFIVGALLASAALLWQQKLLNPKQPSFESQFPQWQGKGATIWNTNTLQKTHTVVIARELTHFKAPSHTLTQQPHGLFLSTSKNYYFKAQKGILRPKQFTLQQQAHVEQHTPNQPTVYLYGDSLSFFPARGRLTSPTTVKITQKKNWVTGTGLTLDTKAETFELRHNVMSHYEQN